MAQIGTLTTGAAVTTIIAGQAQCESIIVLGTIATAMPLQGLQIEIDGVPFINISNQPTLLAAYAKWCNQVNATGAIIGVAMKVTTGRIFRTTTYRFTNNGATTPAIFAFSNNSNGVPFLVGTKQINASSYEDFQKFSAIFIGTPANVSSAEVTFTNGTKSTLAPAEIDALFGIQFPNEAGELAAVAIMDNRDQSIANVRLNCSAANTIMIAKLPDPSFQMMKQIAAR